MVLDQIECICMSGETVAASERWPTAVSHWSATRYALSPALLPAAPAIRTSKPLVDAQALCRKRLNLAYTSSTDSRSSSSDMSFCDRATASGSGAWVGHRPGRSNVGSVTWLAERIALPCSTGLQQHLQLVASLGKEERALLQTAVYHGTLRGAGGGGSSALKQLEPDPDGCVSLRAGTLDKGDAEARFASGGLCSANTRILPQRPL